VDSAENRVGIFMAIRILATITGAATSVMLPRFIRVSLTDPPGIYRSTQLSPFSFPLAFFVTIVQLTKVTDWCAS
jgi:hypothetical protein